MSDGPLFCVQYTGSNVVALGKDGLFQNGTTAYVGESSASLARSLGQFTVTGPFGEAPAVAKKSAAEATQAEEAARAKATPAAPEAPKPAPAPAAAPAPAPAKAEEKPAEKKEEAPKAEEKKADAPPAPAPAAT